MTASAGPKSHRAGALVLVLDRSGSMQGEKLAASKAAALAAVDALAPDDQVAIIAFDSEASVLVRLQPAKNRQRIAKELARLSSGGGTTFLPALEEAFDVLRDLKVATKHIILLSDGEAPSDGIAERVDEMRTAGITISTVGVDGADRALLAMIADAGGGSLYLIGDLNALPKALVEDVRSGFGRPPPGVK